AAGGTSGATMCLDCPDPQAAFRVADLHDAWPRSSTPPAASRLHSRVRRRPPDHDSTPRPCTRPFATKVATPIAEFAGYHANGPDMESECFLESPEDVLLRPLTAAEGCWKREVLDCYASRAA